MKPYPLLKAYARGRKNLRNMGMTFALEGELGTARPPLIDMVEEFWDVFREELPSLPLDREIEFCIDLFSGTYLGSIPRDRMTSSELDELRK